MTIADELADYVATIEFSDLSEKTLHAAKILLVDSLGCAIGAIREKPIRMAMDAIQNTKGTYASSILSTKRTVSPDHAAFINGAMVRYFDYNDTYLSKEPAHPSDNIFPILAVAEAEGRNGRDALLGIVLAYELQCRLCDAANLWKKGWDHVNYGLISVSAASSRLMRLAPEKIAHAINMALNSHITMRQVRAGELSMFKALSFCNTARNAVFSAMLAKHGITGPAPIFEGEMGFWKQVSGEFKLDILGFGNNSKPFKIEKVIIKYFPAEIHSQTIILAAREAKKEISNLENIEMIEIGTHEAGYKIIGKDPEKWAPKTRETADHSIAYIALAVLMDGRIDKQTFDEKRFKDPKTLELLKKVTVYENPEFTALYPESIPNELKITLKDGKTIHKKAIYPKGHPKNPLDDSEIEEKFKQLTKTFLNEKKQNAIIETIWNFEKIKDLRTLFSLCILRK